MISQIPIKVTVSPTRIKKGYIAKAGTTLVLNNHELYITGFSYNSSQTDAIKIAKAEVWERAFGHIGHPLEFKNYIGKKYQSNELRNFKASEILLGSNKFLDSSGLAFHTDKQSAAQHAVFELIERHYLALLWYYDTKLIEIENHIEQINNYHIKYYTLAVDTYIPFIICVVTDKENKIWLCGSSVKTDYLSAMNAAKNEAILLLNGILDSNNSHCYSTETMERLMSLMNPSISNIRNKFFLNKVNKKTVMAETQSMKQKNIFNSDMHDIYIITLLQEKNAFVVRALSEKLLKIREERVKNINTNIPLDPFC